MSLLWLLRMVTKPSIVSAKCENTGLLFNASRRFSSRVVAREYLPTNEKTANRGTISNRTHGLRMEGRRTALRPKSISWAAYRKVVGSISSKKAISVEKRFKTRPTGFVSKNSTGALSTAVSILWWRACEEFSVVLKNRNDLTSTKRAATTTNPA